MSRSSGEGRFTGTGFFTEVMEANGVRVPIEKRATSVRIGWGVVPSAVELRGGGGLREHGFYATFDSPVT